MSVPIEDLPSPNYSSREGTPITLVVLHYTGMPSAEEALDRLRDPEAGVSSHYFIEQDGRIVRLVDEKDRAHHAGLGAWGPVRDVNSASIGIEIVNKGHLWGYEDFPDLQIDALIGLMTEIYRRHRLGPLAAIAHSDLAPARKDDPGERFPWDRLAASRLAIGQWHPGEDPPPPDYDDSLTQLTEIGYGLDRSFPVPAVLAFQRRFAPRLLGQALSPATRQAIRWVHGQVIAERLRPGP
ncbi:N-acetylmuramoyl-L-alanine amidase [Parvularcula bermudensis HTCC2503]|uniref:N-acetylmuramoyl-L-alanine amidase n=1 Tax=Parvularcula bermudensis (strain ATCC BAA-594 / HTCC2503 / KCTC 12087) TaxID=314260 RepID=E0TGQ4_PARBH|nr:N-acetylmuramoyl-L-alanine amidase [Parvularcula bermudensis]ADM10663.1 N-acetylmuramoyl-L-alanine amidase [Parvularcula bermudensis HTCC2503]